jgi:hypothetical protein
MRHKRLHMGVMLVLAVGVIAAAAGAQRGVINPVPEGPPDLYVASLCIVAGFPKDPDNPPPREYGGMYRDPIPKAEFLDEGALAEKMDPEGLLDIQVSPLYSVVCGPTCGGRIEGGAGDRRWFAEVVRVEPRPDGTVRRFGFHDLFRVTGARGGTQEEPGWDDVKLGHADVAGVGHPGALPGAQFVAEWWIVEPAWP